MYVKSPYAVASLKPARASSMARPGAVDYAEVLTRCTLDSLLWLWLKFCNLCSAEWLAFILVPLLWRLFIPMHTMVPIFWLLVIFLFLVILIVLDDVMEGCKNAVFPWPSFEGAFSVAILSSFAAIGTSSFGCVSRRSVRLSQSLTLLYSGVHQRIT